MVLIIIYYFHFEVMLDLYFTHMFFIHIISNLILVILYLYSGLMILLFAFVLVILVVI
jgi:hypothetical protein